MSDTSQLRSPHRIPRRTIVFFAVILTISVGFGGQLWEARAAANHPNTVQADSAAQSGETLEVAWQYEPPLLNGIEFGDSTLIGDRFIRKVSIDSGDDTYDFTGIEAIDARDGTILWQTPLDWSRQGFAASSSQIFTTTESGTLVALDAATGEESWSVTSPNELSTLGFGHDTLYAWSSENVLSGYNPASGDVLWQSEPTSATPIQRISDVYIRSDPIRFGESTIVAVDGDLALQAFNLDGSSAWSSDSLIPPDPNGNPPGLVTITAGNVLVSMIPNGNGGQTENGAYQRPSQQATAYDMTSGKQLWSLSLIGLENATGSMSDEPLIYAAADGVSDTSSATPQPALSVDATGDVAWPEWTPTAYDRQNYFPGAKSVFAIDAQTGAIVWEQHTGAGDFLGVHASATPGVWASTADGKLVHLAAENGALLGEPFWPFEGYPGNTIFKQLFVSDNGQSIVAFILGASVIGISIR